jgi:cytochrome b561
MHSLLLSMPVALPITGYFISTSAGQPIDIFGWFEIPSIVVINNTARDVAIDLHYYFGYGTGLLACLHVAAALKHHFIDRDETLIRMLRRSSHSKW